MGNQLPAVCQHEATLMSWECPLAIEASHCTSKQLRRFQLGTESSRVVREGEKAYRMWDAPSLSDYVLADVHSDDHEIHLSKKHRRNLLQSVQDLEKKE